MGQPGAFRDESLGSFIEMRVKGEKKRVSELELSQACQDLGTWWRDEADWNLKYCGFSRINCPLDGRFQIQGFINPFRMATESFRDFHVIGTNIDAKSFSLLERSLFRVLDHAPATIIGNKNHEWSFLLDCSIQFLHVEKE